MASVSRRLLIDEKGQGLAEYAIAMAVIALAIIVAVQLFNTNVVDVWNHNATVLQNAAG